MKHDRPGESSTLIGLLLTVTAVSTKCAAVVIFRVKVSRGPGGCFTSLDGI